MNESFGQYKLEGLGQINVILGKNGCGKSSILRAFNQNRRSEALVKYIPPERGGNLVRDGSFETNMQNDGWLNEVRNKRNRFDQFRQNSVAEFRTLETLVLREIEKDTKKRSDPTYTFDTVVGQLNSLLENVELFRSSDAGFGVKNRGEKGGRSTEDLSSGEVELISLGVEILSFGYASKDQKYSGKSNWLLFDEPDVHLHPDLQHRLMKLLAEVVKEKQFNVLMTTHSTAILSALAEFSHVKFALMSRKQVSLKFDSVTEATKAVLPIFGAHPLSNVFNNFPLLLVEGEDDERIWQQATRSSRGEIKVWPRAAGDVQSLHEYEGLAASILNAVYESPRAYSVRDRDDDAYDIDDIGPIVRSRLNCRAAENLLLSEDVLQFLGTSWEIICAKLDDWIESNPEHLQYCAVKLFKTGGWDRRNADLKTLRNLLMAIAGSSKPWEVAVGQCIAKLKSGAPTGEHTLTDYLGAKLTSALKLHP